MPLVASSRLDAHNERWCDMTDVISSYRFSWAAYEAWLARLGPRLSWAAFPDLPCEQSLAPLNIQIRARQEQTLQWAWELWGGFDDTENWQVHRAHSWSYVATAQGRTVGQYVRHAEQLAPLLAQQFDHYHYTAHGLDLVDVFGEDAAHAARAWAQHAATHYRVGIGSLCGRNQPVEVAELVRIVTAVAEVLPWPFHLWGVKLNCLRALARAGLMSRIASFDTAAFNGAFGRNLERRRQECRALGLTQLDFLPWQTAGGFPLRRQHRPASTRAVDASPVGQHPILHVQTPLAQRPEYFWRRSRLHSPDTRKPRSRIALGSHATRRPHACRRNRFATCTRRAQPRRCTRFFEHATPRRYGVWPTPYRGSHGSTPTSGAPGSRAAQLFPWPTPSSPERAGLRQRFRRVQLSACERFGG